MKDQISKEEVRSINKQEYIVILFYKYTEIENPESLLERELAVCEVLDIKGRLIIAGEGINATLEGTKENIEKYKVHIKKDKRFKHLDVKESVGNGKAFPRLSIKVRDEIVSTKLPKSIDPSKSTGKHLSPTELKKWYDEDKDFVVLDMRNDYELNSGYFEKTVNIGLKNSRDLQDKLESLKIHKDKTVVTVCTGGVRCEKMSEYLIDQGFKDVNQLHNGIHGYMKKYPGENYLGTLYTFDQRVTMDFGAGKDSSRIVIGKCADCDASSETYYDMYEKVNKDTHDGHVILCEVCADIKNLKKYASRK